MRRFLLVGVTVAAVGGSLIPAGAGAAAGPPNVIRVGWRSEPTEAKVAMVGTSANHAGESFTVVNSSGATVFSGTLTAVTPSAPWAHLAAADLSGLRALGSYRVRAAGLRSRVWEIADGATRGPISSLLGFFNANRDGTEPSTLHGAAHLNDATVASGPHSQESIALSGGWMDAGDMLHFTETTGYATVALQIAAQLDPTHAATLTDEADVGVRWLQRAHPAPGLFIGMVGDERDHDLGWRRPESDDASALPGIGHRLAYPTTRSSLAGKAAAALAMAAERSSGVPRTQLLTSATEWYNAGVVTGGLGTALPGDFYVDDTFHDDLALAAMALYRVTGDASYLSAASTHLGLTTTSELGWFDTTALVGADICGVLGHGAVADPAVRTLGCSRLRSAANGALANAAANPWGTPGLYDWGFTAENGGNATAIALAQRASLIGASDVPSRARDYLFGNNQWGRSLVVGVGPSNARRPHHWAHVIGFGRPVGAVVGGPAERAQITAQGFSAPGALNTASASYVDGAANYVTSEPALDYTVNSILLLASL